MSVAFSPNQLAANAWYKPGAPPSLINGHLDESFGDPARWPRLRRLLQARRGSFGIMAAEIAHLDSRWGLLPLLRRARIRTAVEVPAFTQPIDGATLARMELHGDGELARIFQVERPRGWFVTRDGRDFVPDELLFDERLPNLLPTFDPVRLATTPGNWAARKDAARQLDPFTAARQPFARLLGALIEDYVAYLTVARARWGKRMPAIGLHWNVNPGWEWRDEAGLDRIQTIAPDAQRDPATWHRNVFTRPQYGSVAYLERLVDRLRAAGFPPKTVYADVDWTYDLPYVAEVMRRHKASLARRGVRFAVNVVEASLADDEALAWDGKTLARRRDPKADPNALYAETLLAIAAFLKASGIYERGVLLRVGSWSHRPYETGAQVDESRPGSLAHTARAIFERL